jgi:hypothetical protein
MAASRAASDATTAAPTSVLGFITAPRGVRAHRTQCAPVSPQWGIRAASAMANSAKGILT